MKIPFFKFCICSSHFVIYRKSEHPQHTSFWPWIRLCLTGRKPNLFIFSILSQPLLLIALCTPLRFKFIPQGYSTFGSSAASTVTPQSRWSNSPVIGFILLEIIKLCTIICSLCRQVFYCEFNFLGEFSTAFSLCIFLTSNTLEWITFSIKMPKYHIRLRIQAFHSNYRYSTCRN